MVIERVLNQLEYLLNNFMNITLLIIDISVFNPRGNFLLKMIMVGQIKIIRAHKLKFQTAKNNFSYVNNKVKFNIKADY